MPVKRKLIALVLGSAVLICALVVAGDRQPNPSSSTSGAGAVDWESRTLPRALDKYQDRIVAGLRNFHWMRRGLGRVSSWVAKAPRDQLHVEEAAVLDQIAACDVLLVGDIHDADESRVQLKRVLRTVRAAGRSAVLLLEGLPVEFKGQGSDQIIASMRRNWPWPLGAYSDVLELGQELGIPVLGVGFRLPDHLAERTASLGEAERSGLPVEDYLPELSMRAFDEQLVKKLKSTFETESPGTCAVVFVGAAHLVEGGRSELLSMIKSTLPTRTVCRLLPFMAVIEARAWIRGTKTARQPLRLCDSFFRWPVYEYAAADAGPRSRSDLSQESIQLRLRRLDSLGAEGRIADASKLVWDCAWLAMTDEVMRRELSKLFHDDGGRLGLLAAAVLSRFQLLDDAQLNRLGKAIKRCESLWLRRRLVRNMKAYGPRALPSLKRVVAHDDGLGGAPRQDLLRRKHEIGEEWPWSNRLWRTCGGSR